ncbi:hypothetical protein ACOYR1_11590 [Thalassotalea piscium]
MDIFTTALTKVVPIIIKPESLKVKALLKEPEIKALSDDANRLENHERYYFIKGKEESSHSSQSHQEENKEEGECEEGIKASEDVIIHKDEILHPKDHHKESDDDDITHLDIFV